MANEISPNTLVAWLVAAFGAVILAAVIWVGSNTAEIPVIKNQQTTQSNDLMAIKAQIIDVPVIKVQMENIAKQLEHVNSAQDTSGRAIEENRNRISNIENRLQQIESRRK